MFQLSFGSSLVSLLDVNNLVLKALAPGEKSLFKALSSALYLTSSFADAVQSACVETANQFLNTKQIPNSLHVVKSKLPVLYDYIHHSDNSEYDLLTVEIFSWRYKVAVTVYFMSTDQTHLQSQNIVTLKDATANKVKIFKHASGFYEPAFDASLYANLGFVQNIVLNLIDRTLSKEDSAIGWKNINDDTYINIEYERGKNPPEFYRDKTKRRALSQSDIREPNALINELTIDERPHILAGLSNRPISFSNMSSVANSAKNISGGGKIFFSNDVGESELGRTAGSYLQAPPPGLTPTPSRYPNKSFSFTSAKIPSFGSEKAIGQGDGRLGTPSKGGAFFGTDTSLKIPPDQAQKGSNEKKKPVILEESKERYSGKLKFFDEGKNYGFIIMDQDGSDIFVHFDDLSKASVTKEMLRKTKDGLELKFTFSCMSYVGKYNKSRKAVEIQLL